MRGRSRRRSAPRILLDRAYAHARRALGCGWPRGQRRRLRLPAARRSPGDRQLFQDADQSRDDQLRWPDDHRAGGVRPIRPARQVHRRHGHRRQRPPHPPRTRAPQRGLHRRHHQGRPQPVRGDHGGRGHRRAHRAVGSRREAAPQGARDSRAARSSRRGCCTWTTSIRRRRSSLARSRGMPASW